MRRLTKSRPQSRAHCNLGYFSTTFRQSHLFPMASVKPEGEDKALSSFKPDFILTCHPGGGICKRKVPPHENTVEDFCPRQGIPFWGSDETGGWSWQSNDFPGHLFMPHTASSSAAGWGGIARRWMAAAMTYLLRYTRFSVNCPLPW